ncbi:fibroblast growth factor-binding protein 1-like isoform 1-T2 [Odontesthes bonariensis]|uniref:fibroblast growth factor-binding protein 1-like n=1 Tax=Odontesthes bonariensis TaxID=219752 RepID=UPI003F58F3CC
MMVLRAFALWLLLAFLEQQVSLSSGERAADKLSGRAQRSGNKGAATGRGKFSTGDKMQCTWNSRDVRDTVKILVTCKNPGAQVKHEVTGLSCEYNAKPQSCPGYQSDPKGFWKQVARTLRKLQGKLCRDELALVKTAMCKRASRDAHFKLDIRSLLIVRRSGESSTSTPPPRSRPTTTTTSSSSQTACTKRPDHRKTAEEYCSSSWASVCSFFLSMLQSDDC